MTRRLADVPELRKNWKYVVAGTVSSGVAVRLLRFSYHSRYLNSFIDSFSFVWFTWISNVPLELAVQGHICSHAA